MYLRRVTSGDCDHFIIRESIRSDGRWKYRDILDLGCDPGNYIIYPGSYGFYFDSVLEEALEARGAKYSDAELELMLLPFMKPHIQQILNRFHNMGRSPTRMPRLSDAEILENQRNLHAFDKRRLHYLKFGRLDIGELDGRPWRFLKVLFGKSRDEIEHTLEGMESILRPHEIRSYIYASLDLQSHFSNHLLRNHPGALDPEIVDEVFLKEICHLNSDEGFFMGHEEGRGASLHHYLTKYVILYFDHAFEGIDPNEAAREYVRRHRAYRAPPDTSKKMAVEEACAILGISVARMREMTRIDLVRLYRKKVMEAHPDKGGSHEEFVKITRAFEVLSVGK